MCRHFNHPFLIDKNQIETKHQQQQYQKAKQTHIFVYRLIFDKKTHKLRAKEEEEEVKLRALES